jgi:hypothetical protein
MQLALQGRNTQAVDLGLQCNLRYSPVRAKYISPGCKAWEKDCENTDIAL